MNRADRSPMGFTEFVGFIAACMALNALAIDVMLPALPMLHADFSLTDPNQAQAVIGVYLLGMGMSQLVYGPLSDRYGRRPVLIGGLIVFAVAGFLSAITDSFATLLAARLLQGVGAGAPRVIAVSLARDKYSGPQMGKVMSLAMMVFMAVPILAPSMGQLILLVAPWRWAFGALVVAGTVVLSWTLLRLQESLPPERRRAISATAIFGAYRITLSSRVAVGYMLALGLVVGGHMGFITSAQQIFVDVFDVGRSFTLLFAAVAASLAVAAFTNSRLVHRFGMRRIALTGLAVLVGINLVHLGLALTGRETLLVFMLLQGGSVFLFGFLASNLNTLAMEPLGHVAGTASSMIGFFSTVTGALIGLLIGHLFNGSVSPLIVAYVVLGALALVTVYYTERTPVPAA
ncbi:multidrug effflux MFS transporter [Azoarcus sp. L1K30]|uniref:multidrug effflux MFS transporter n=1 Tax=Azoarcus sp. L1K30 TaxID=2820277 RepID=UPI001B825ADD|nr:multidrug effflux MFS transporter [Azoarcus sp. L1K30]MBR0564902.1 multidrug effflux MFS transporter [Azoarcus sp. L1K30]